jgi:sugar phosphate isomerase/epimerase
MLAINTNALKDMSVLDIVVWLTTSEDWADGQPAVELTTDSKVHAYELMSYNFEQSLSTLGFYVPCLSGGWVDFVTDDLDFLYKQLRFCKYYHIPQIRLFVHNPHWDLKWNEMDMLFAANSISCAANFASQEYPGIDLLFENHGGLTATGQQTRQLLDEVRAFNVGTVFDPANYVASGADPIEAFHQVFSYIRHIHVKDIDKNGEFCAVGEGVLEWEYYLAHTINNGYQGWFSVEYEGSGNKREGLLKSFRKFKELSQCAEKR